MKSPLKKRSVVVKLNVCECIDRGVYNFLCCRTCLSGAKLAAAKGYMLDS